MLKQPNFFYSQPSTLPREALAKFYLSMTFDLTPFWTGFFANLKRVGGGGGGEAKWLPPNLDISSQMTMKLGKDILWVEIFTN